MKGKIFRRYVSLGMMVLAALVGSELAKAQSVDFPMFKGDVARTGRNDVVNSNPGEANLRWFTPYGTSETTTVIVDNTDASDAFSQIDDGLNARAYPGGPYDTNPYGVVNTFPVYAPQKAIGTYSTTTEWCPPTLTSTDNYEASGPYTLPRRRQAIGANPADYASRAPSYVFTRCIPSAVGTDPTVAQNNSQRRIFQWRVTGPTSTPRQYALYVWLPVGPTRIGPGANDLLFPQRYYAYEILFGDNERFVDVVDTYASGGGWVRLGGGGRPTNALFQYSGRTSIRITLRNTMPRDAAGQLTMPNAPQDYIVYADAVKAVPASGEYTAGPVVGGFGTADIRTLAVNNTSTFSPDRSNPLNLISRTAPEATSYNHNFSNSNLARNTRFVYSPVNNAIGEGNVDDSSTQVTFDPSWTPTPDARYLNGSGHELPITNTLSSAERATYAPLLSDGDYDVYVYLPGTSGTKVYGATTRYEILEGTTQTNLTVRQTDGPGWFRLGNRRYRHRLATSTTQPTPAPLSVRVTNFSNTASDAGRISVADGVRFVGTGNLSVKSTPLMANITLALEGGGTETRRVAIIADESGRIHCIDARGSDDQTTQVYWTYPSIKRNSTYVDPNLGEGIDGPNIPPPTADSIAVAEAPTGFNTSSALVQRISGKDYLYISSTNGRVYCLEMEGRGDYDASSRLPGTTRRVWTFPDDFPTTKRATSLGRASGSVAYGVVAGRPSIIIPTEEGRIYAVDALPVLPGNITGRTTNIRWVYPPVSQAPLGPISMTPAVEFNRVYVGSQQNSSAYRQFHALNIDTGSPVWSFPSNADLGTSAKFRTSSWTSSPVTVPAATLGGGMPNTVFALNDNGYLFALNATDGSELWSTEELATSSTTSLGFTFLSVFNNVGGRTQAPVVLLPAQDGRLTALYARTSDLNRFGTRRAWEYVTNGETVTAPVATGNGFMYLGDNLGFLYAFNNDTGLPITPGVVPGQQTIVENDVRADVFREGKIGVINRSAYNRLRLAPTDPNHLSYNDLIDPATRLIRPAFTFVRSPLTFEWGETAYFVVYDFPFLTVNRANNNPVPPPVVNFTFSVGGQSNRSIPVEARQFRDPATAPANGSTLNQGTGDPTLRNAGYGVIAFTLQGGGANALPPGDGTIAASISTQGLTSQQVLQNIALDPAYSRLRFNVANPIAIVMSLLNPAVVPADSAVGMGLSNNPSHVENLVNGSPDIDSTAKNELKLLQTAGEIDHGKARTARVYVIDRSMMSLIRGDGQGLDNVRVERGGLAWQGQGQTVYKPLDPVLYPGFEDLPTRVPNNSLDYPDIREDNVRITKDPNGRPENPVFATAGVTLNPPLVNDGGTLRALQEGDAPEDRVFQPTVFDFEVNVPRFQPPNVGRIRYNQGLIASGGVPGDPRQLMVDSNGSLLTQGYIGQMRVYVDSAQNGSLETNREAFRSFSVAASVLAQEKLRVLTPTVDPSSSENTVDLGSLPTGSGKVLVPGTYGPGTVRFSPTFQPFTVLNEGNVNMLNVRLAKTFTTPGNPRLPVAFDSRNQDQQAWLDGSLDLWANFDVPFAPLYSGVNRQIIQKPRATDSVPTQLVVNPSRRENGVLGVGVQSLIPGLPSEDPKVSVTVPIGFPIGTYSQILRVIENQSISDAAPESLDPVGGTGGRLIETFSDPSFRLIFKTRESRLTNRATQYSDPQVEGTLPDNATLAYKNAQPSLFRSLGGHLALAFSSTRPESNPVPPAPTTVPVNEPWRIYFAGLGSATSFTDVGNTTPGSAGYSPIRDLNFWNAAGASSWWRLSAASATGYPSAATNYATLFGLPVAPDPSAVRFFHPSFPATGNGVALSPSSVSTQFASAIMAFIGEARDANGALVSRVFATDVSIDSSGQITAGAPIPLPFDSTSRKGKPTVVQTSASTAIVFYPATSGNFTGVMAAQLNAAVDPGTGSRWSAPVALPFGTTFEGVTGVSATVRPYQNVTSSPVIELVITGKVRGSARSETFITRVRPTTPTLGLPVLESGLDPAALAFPFVDRSEAVIRISDGLYRVQGVFWDYSENVDLAMSLNGTTTSLLRGGRTVDPQTGVISFETTLGGRVYLEPSNGRVRFTGGVPPRNAVISLVYTPYALRISEGDSNYAAPSVAFDNHRTSDISWWQNGAWNDSRLRNDRLIVTTVREGGSGQAPRPVVKTMRFGVQLPYAFATDDSGYPLSVTVTGNTQPFMVDPARRAIYFTSADEARTVTVTYTALLPGPGQGTATSFSATAQVGLVTESSEVLVPIEQAVNESGLSTFLDPFDPQSSDVRLRRPTMMWMVWTSTRAGSPDVYMQTYAPRLAPVGSGR